ncbi:MAG: hypothetical protein MUF87_04890 [Anaerolineae bacterium]|jgi:hypothetical protein|nr:hypothetical protein [Anaerolineae bacterium]
MTGDGQTYFRVLLTTVVGQAFTAAGYALNEQPIQWAGGQYRFVHAGLSTAIQFQHLLYQDTEWSSGQPSRFRVVLIRSDGHQRDLSRLVVEDFGVAILPSSRHWWTYRNTHELGQALAEAGHLIIGYGMPWLSGDLIPPER